MEEQLWQLVGWIRDGLAILGGAYVLYEELWRRRRAERADVNRINALVKEDLLPPAMKDKKIKPDEYLLYGLNELTRIVDRRVTELRKTIAASK